MNEPNQASQVSESASQPTPKTGGNNAGIIVGIILGVLFLAAATGTGYFYYQNSKAKKQVNQLNSQIEQLNSQIKDLQSQIDEAKTTREGSENSSSTTDTSGTASTTSTCKKTGTMPTNGYVIADSNTRQIAEAELTNLTPWQLKVARNEIYARHGRAFVSKDLSCYFAGQNWYSVNSSYSSSQLTTTENKNVATILNYEKKTDSSCLSKDAGC